MSILKKILPKKLHKTKFVKNKILGSMSAGYNIDDDKIYFSRKSLISEKWLKKAMEKYLNEKLTRKEYLLFNLLHELGHRYNVKILKSFNRDRHRQQRNYLVAFIYGDDEIKNNLLYWEYVEEEKRAMTFAKKYLKIYKQYFKRKSLF